MACLPNDLPLARRRAGCPRGGIGRRARLKIEFRKECPFEPDRGHQHKKGAVRTDCAFFHAQTETMRHLAGVILLVKMQPWTHAQGHRAIRRAATWRRYR